MVAASDVGNFFNPIVKNVCPACVKIPIPIIQIKSLILGVTQLKNTIGDNVITDIKGKSVSYTHLTLPTSDLV